MEGKVLITALYAGMWRHIDSTQVSGHSGSSGSGAHPIR